MVNEIVVTIILDDEANVLDTKVQFTTASTIPYEAIDYIIADTLRHTSNRIFDKITKQNINNQLN
jgi:hypothetical protein